MTVSAIAPRNDYLGNNTTPTYSYGFRIFAATDLRVTVQDTAGALTRLVYLTDYTITGVGNGAGGTITLLGGNLATNYLLTLRFDRTPVQSTDLRNQGGFFPETHEQKFDELTRYVQQLTDLVARSLRLPETEAGTDLLTTLPPVALRAGTRLAFDDLGNLTTVTGDVSGAAVSGFGATLIDDASAAAARTTLGVPAASGGAMTNAVLTTSTAAADPVTALGLATKQYVDAVPGGTVASYSANGTIGAGVKMAILSGATFTLGLNTAVGHNGEEITFVHAGTSLSQLYTIDPNGAEIIDGTATFVLYTVGERLTVVSDNVNWVKKSHDAETDWVDAGAMTIQATTSNPTKPTTPDIDKVYWRRRGNHVFLRYILRISSAAGSAAGSGNYLFVLPTNITFDTTVVSPVAAALTAANRSEASASFLDGVGMAGVDSSSFNQCTFYAYGANAFQVFAAGASNAAISDGTMVLTNAELAYNFELSARAANWRL